MLWRSASSIAVYISGAKDFKPGEQRRSEIKADPRVIADDIRDALLIVEDPRGCIRRVTFGRYTLVPVVIGMGRILDLDCLQARGSPAAADKNDREYR